jgi:hypothetical protein
MSGPQDSERIEEKKAPSYEGPLERKSSLRSDRKGSVVDAEVLQGEIFDHGYEQTQRGLKSRHAQMIALGGTIGSCDYPCNQVYLLKTGQELVYSSGQGKHSLEVVLLLS